MSLGFEICHFDAKKESKKTPKMLAVAPIHLCASFLTFIFSV